MQTENLEGQESIFGQDSAYGKMSSVLSQVGGTLKRVKKSLGRIFKKSSKRSSKLKNHTFMLLDLRPGAGNMLGAYWEYDPPWLGSFGMLNTSECPKDAVECSLWQILQATAPSRYSLSQTACLGILRRAACRGKSLPPLLEAALRMQAGLDPPAPISGEAKAYYGLNATSGNMILADRKKLKTPNGMILGTPGSGKSFSAKRSIVGVFLNTKDDILICDPEAEYFPLVNRLEGQVIKISPTSTQYVNPMDINLNYSEDDNPLALKSDFILSFCELAAGGRNGLEPVEKTVIDRAVRIVYRPYIADPLPENMPLLEDLYDEIKRQPEPEAQRIAAALELYVHGSLNVFNHRTNVDINNRIVCFDIKELGKQLKSLGMLVIQDQVWNRVSQNRDQGKSTWYFVDEFHLLLRGEVGSWSVEIWKRFRKWGGIPTGITQNIKDLLSSPEIENIFENSDFVYLLNQASGDRKILCERLNISNQQAAHISNAGPGEGLIFFGNVILPFVDDFPKDNELYSIMTTKLGETGKGENEHE